MHQENANGLKQHNHQKFTDEWDEDKQEFTDSETVRDEGNLVKAAANSMIDNSPVYEDGSQPIPNTQRITKASQSLSHYVDIVDEATDGPVHTQNPFE